jgi:hypothetical protein
MNASIVRSVSGLFRFTLTLALLFVALTALGCQSAKIGKPATEDNGGPAAEAEMEFWHTLAIRPIASNDEVFHAMALFFEGKDPATTYAQRLDAAKARNWVAGDFAEPGDVTMRRGTFARGIAQGMKLEGGVLMRIVGPQPRYALRELEYMDLMPNSTEMQSLSGADLMAVIGRVEDYEKLQGIKAPGGEAALHRAAMLVIVNARQQELVAHAQFIRDHQFAVATAARFVGAVMSTVGQPVDVHPKLLSFYADPPVDPAVTKPQSGAKPEPKADPNVKPLPADPNAKPAASAKATIAEVRGMVQFRAVEADPWKPVVVGQVVDVGGEFRTGLRSAVVFTMPPGQTIKLERLGTMKLLDATKVGGKSVTNVGVKYGVGEVHVEAGGQEHETTVATPGMTLAVRGTTANINNHGSFPPVIHGRDGVVHITNTVLGVQYSIAGKGKQAVTNSTVATGAEYALKESVVDPAGERGRTEAEALIAITQPAISFTQTVSAVQETSQQSVAGTEQPPPSGIQAVSGSLNVTVQWQSLATGAADLNLSLITPNANTISAGSGSADGLSHSGDRISSGPGNFANESVGSSSEGVVPGSYTAVVKNLGPQKASGVISAFATTPIEGSQTPLNQGFTLKSGSTARFNFTVAP